MSDWKRKGYPVTSISKKRGKEPLNTIPVIPIPSVIEDPGPTRSVTSISEVVSLKDLQISYNIVKTKVDEIEKSYIVENSSIPNRQLDSKVIHSNIRGVTVLPLEFMKTDETPVNVVLADRYLKINPKKTLIRDSEIRKYIDYRFEELQDTIQSVKLNSPLYDLGQDSGGDNEVNTNTLLEIGTIFRVVAGIKDLSEYIYYIVREGNKICQIPNSATVQVLLMERDLKLRNIAIMEEPYLKVFDIIGVCESRDSEWVPRFELETGFADPELPDFEDDNGGNEGDKEPVEPVEQVVKVQIINTGPDGENCLPVCGGLGTNNTPAPVATRAPTGPPTYPATPEGSLARIRERYGGSLRTGPHVIARCHTCIKGKKGRYMSQDSYNYYITNYHSIEKFTHKGPYYNGVVGYNDGKKVRPLQPYHLKSPIQPPYGTVIDIPHPTQAGKTVKHHTYSGGGRRSSYHSEKLHLKYSYSQLSAMAEAKDNREIYVDYYDERECSLGNQGFPIKGQGQNFTGLTAGSPVGVLSR